MQKKSAAERDLKSIEEMDAEYQNLRELYAIAPDDADVIAAIEKLADDARRAAYVTLFNEPADGNNAFLFIQAGAGGRRCSRKLSRHEYLSGICQN